MSEAVSKKVSVAPATKSNSDSSFGVLKLLLLVFLAGLSAWAYKTTLPSPPNKLGSPDGLPITSPRIQLRDGRNLSYTELGVPKDVAKSKIIYIHCFGCNKYINPFAITSPDVLEELGVYIVSIDRPGYGESDPDPKRTVKSLALDIEEFADHLNLGPKFYVAGFSLGGQVVWSCLKYIPQRIAGAILISPTVNYWWHNLPSNLTNEAYSRLLHQDQWCIRVAHYLPWLTYWWNTQSWFPGCAVTGNQAYLSSADIEIASKLLSTTDPNLISQAIRQGEFESIHRDLNIVFGKWEFDPIDLENSFPNNDGSVHLWMGAEDLSVSATLQSYIAQQLGWIKYHEVTDGGHIFAFKEGMGDIILKEILYKKK